MSAAATRVTVEVPATSANLGAGFDTLGLALDLTNSIRLEAAPHPGVHVTVEGFGADTLPRGNENLVAQVVHRFYTEAGMPRPAGLHIHQVNRIPLFGGLGSSATAIVGGLLAASAFSGAKWGVDAILNLASKIEGHPDNVAPALLGGLVTSILTPSGAVKAVSVPVNEAWRVAAVLVIPPVEVNTRAARAALPDQVSLADAVHNLGRAALFVAAVAAGRTELLGEAMQDKLHQQRRAQFIPGLVEALTAAEKAGALGACLSGSGPTVLALVEPHRAEAVSDAMLGAFDAVGVGAQVYHTVPRFDGAGGRKKA